MTTQQDTLLVVGGTGFIGRHFVNRAADLGYQITVLSLHQPAPINIIKHVDYIAADLSSSQQVYQQLEGKHFNYVVNFGGYINHAQYLSGGQQVIDTHFNGVQNLIQHLDWHSLKAFVQIGSSDEYGNQRSPQKESLKEIPISPYSFAKTAVSQMLQMLHRTEKFPAIILRLFLVYGPMQNKQRFLPQIITGCLDNKSFPTSQGDQLRDFCFIDDIVDGIFKAIASPSAYGEVINLASGKPIKIRSILDKVKDIIGLGDPQYGQFPYRKDENMSLYADITKAKQLLSWNPTTTLEDGLIQTIDYYRNNLSSST